MLIFLLYPEGSEHLEKWDSSLAHPFPFLFLLSLTFPFPFPSLEVGPLKPVEHCKLPQWGPGRSPGRKRIWCSLELSENHWWQLFWVFWSAWFTVNRSKFCKKWDGLNGKINVQDVLLLKVAGSIAAPKRYVPMPMIVSMYVYYRRQPACMHLRFWFWVELNLTLV